MNAKVKLGGVITLPPDLIEELKLEPGSEVAFGRAPDGKFYVDRAEPAPIQTREQIRAHLDAVSRAARHGLSREFADMTTDEYMEFIRGE